LWGSLKMASDAGDDDMTEREAWKLMAAMCEIGKFNDGWGHMRCGLQRYDGLCDMIMYLRDQRKIAAYKAESMYDKINIHRPWRRNGNHGDYTWALTRRGWQCRRLFCLKMVKEMEKPVCDKCNVAGGWETGPHAEHCKWCDGSGRQIAQIKKREVSMQPESG